MLGCTRKQPLPGIQFKNIHLHKNNENGTWCKLVIHLEYKLQCLILDIFLSLCTLKLTNAVESVILAVSHRMYVLVSFPTSNHTLSDDLLVHFKKPSIICLDNIKYVREYLKTLDKIHFTMLLQNKMLLSWRELIFAGCKYFWNCKLYCMLQAMHKALFDKKLVWFNAFLNSEYVVFLSRRSVHNQRSCLHG